MSIQINIPYLLLTISPKAVSALVEVQAYTVLMIHICSAVPDPEGFQNTEAGEKSDLAGLGHSGTDEWCLEYARFPLRRINVKLPQKQTNFTLISPTDHLSPSLRHVLIY